MTVHSSPTSCTENGSRQVTRSALARYFKSILDPLWMHVSPAALQDQFLEFSVRPENGTWAQAVTGEESQERALVLPLL